MMIPQKRILRQLSLACILMALITACILAFGLGRKAPSERQIASELWKSQPQLHVDAIPILLKWLEEWNPEKENFLESKLSASTYSMIFGSRPGDRAYLATKGFEVLGASADSAVPELVKLLDHKKSYQFAGEAAESGTVFIGTNPKGMTDKEFAEAASQFANGMVRLFGLENAKTVPYR